MSNFFRKIRLQGVLFILLPILYLSIHTGYAQNNKIDSLKSIISKDKTDTAQVNALNKLSLELVQIDSLIEATHYAAIALSLSDKIDYNKGKAYAYKNIGMVNYYKGDFKNVLDSWYNSLAIFKVIQDTLGISNMTNNIGAVLYNTAGYATSLEFYQESLVLAEKINDTHRITAALMNLGGIYTDMEEYEKALASWQQIEKYLPQLNDSDINTAYLMGNGEVYSKKGNHAKALDYYKEILEINQDSINLAWILRNIGVQEDELGNTGKAIEYITLANEIAKKTLNSYGQVQSLTALGKVYESKDLQKAFRAYREAEGLALEIGATNVLGDIYDGMYKVYKDKGDINNAFKYLSKNDSLKDSKIKLEKEENIEKQFFDLQIGKTKEQIGSLQKEAIISELSAKRQKYVIYGAVGSLIVVFLLAMGVFNRYKYVKKTNKIIEEEKNRSESLLLNILPAEIAEELKLKGSAEARDFDLVSILFTDFKEFTKISQKLSANELISEINHCFKAFDDICDKYGIEKIKTIGDSFMAAGGIPIPSEESAKNTILAALEMQSFISKRIKQQQDKNETFFEMRVGIHSGPVVAGIVGVKKFQYDIWGDTVNTASRLESNGEVGRVNISQYTYDLIKDDSNFVFEKRGKIQVKGKGVLEMYFVSAA